MNAEDAFMYSMCGVLAQILMCTAFYYAAFRRLFMNPTSNNVFVILLFLVFFQIGYPITWIWGWVNCRTRQTAWLMTFWTIANTLMVLEFFVISSSSNSSDGEVGITILGTLLMSGITLWGLIPFFRVDERMRQMVQDPTPERIQSFVALGKDILPELEMLLADNYEPTRLVAIECLSKLGANARPILEKASHDEDSVIAHAAQNALLKYTDTDSV